MVASGGLLLFILSCVAGLQHLFLEFITWLGLPTYFSDSSSLIGEQVPQLSCNIMACVDLSGNPTKVTSTGDVATTHATTNAARDRIHFHNSCLCDMFLGWCIPVQDGGAQQGSISNRKYQTHGCCYLQRLQGPVEDTKG